MKRKFALPNLLQHLLVFILILLFCASACGIPISVSRDVRDRIGNFTGPITGTAIDDNIKASLDALHATIGGGGTGDNFYVDSAVAGTAGTSWSAAVATLDAAVVLCADNNFDVIHVAAGHTEDWSSTDSADLDVIGITVIGYGTGTNRPTFTYDSVDSELVIAAANVRIYNLVFYPSIAQVVHAIEIEEDADGSIIDNCEFLDGETAATDEFIDAIQPAAGADNIIISNCIATEALSVATDVANTWLDLTAGVIDNVSVYNNRVRGHYAEACIFSDDIDTLQYVAYNTLTNICTGAFAIEYSTTASGTMIYNYCAADTPGSIIDPGSMENSMNIEADYGAAEDAEAGPAWATGKAVAATENYPYNVEPDSLFALIMCEGTTATATTYNNTTDSLEAIGTDTDAIIATIGSGTGVAIVSGGITSTTMATDCITTDEIADGAIDAGAIAGDAITEAKIADNAIANEHFANDALTATELATDCIGADEVADDAIDAGAIADSSIDAATFVAGAIDASAIAASAIGASELATDCITADEISAAALTELRTYYFGTDVAGSTASSVAAVSTTGVTSAPTASTLADTLHKSGAFSYDNTTDSLEAIRDAVDAIQGIGFRGTAENNSTATTVICADLSGFGDDYFNTGWSLVVIKDNAGAAADPEGKIVDITDYVSSTGTFTVLTTTTAVTTGDEIYIRRTEELELDVPTTLGSAGTVRYVDSGASAGDSTGLTWENAYDTIALAEVACAAGDVVYIADGHDEASGDLVLNIANVSFIGLGKGDARPKLDFDANTDEITINAAGITLKNIRIRPGADKCTKGIHVESAGIGCTLENISFITGEGSDEEFEDCILVDAAAAKLTIRNCTAYNTNATTADADSFINLEDTPLDQCKIIGCYAYGDFTQAPIYWGAGIPTNLLIKGNIVTNITTGQMGIEGTGAATGVMVNNLVCTDAVATSYDPGQLADFGNHWDDFDTHDKAAILWTTNETGVDRWSASELAQIEAEAMDALEAVIIASPTAGSVADIIDRLATKDDSAGATAYPDTVVTDSILAYLMSSDRDPSGYANTTDSLEAIADHIQTLITTAAGSAAYPSGITNESIIAYILSKSGTPAASSFDNETDSLEMISDKVGGFTGDGGADDDDSVKADLDILQAAAGPSYDHTNYLAVATGTFDTTGTWSTVASHEIAAVTGCVRMLIIPECTAGVSSVSDTGTIELGDDVTSDSIIATSTLGSGVMATGELWVDATLTRTILTRTQLNAIEIVICNGSDVGYEVKTNALSGGSMTFHIYWTKMDSTGAVSAGAGGTL